MKKHYLLPVLCYAMVACHEPEKAVENSIGAPPLAAAVGNIAGNAMQLSGPCAVIYTPDSVQTAALKQEEGEEAFYSIAEDYESQLADATAFLEQKGIKTIHPQGGIVQFRSQEGNNIALDLNDKNFSWEIWLFDGKALHNINVADFENEYRKYFK
ncbi:hypothetical protein [Chitinophaga nivalis]|uniref:Lipoprotein n=2 Tax=Chitinophaga nivalis TaxID=2991709 RepID=A0ABT3IPH2_9BACT|nr:hypothetical protein [Chitinophaga nivalis]MCW3485866.1 hypothetical protein [Chitinophaga nivalis]